MRNPKWSKSEKQTVECGCQGVAIRGDKGGIGQKAKFQLYEMN